jgi:hypothetical protein
MGPDNNIAENCIRPFIIGRKNRLFRDTPRGAQARAVFYSLIETAKANGIEPLNRKLFFRRSYCYKLGKQILPAIL